MCSRGKAGDDTALRETPACCGRVDSYDGGCFKLQCSSATTVPLPLHILPLSNTAYNVTKPDTYCCRFICGLFMTSCTITLCASKRYRPLVFLSEVLCSISLALPLLHSPSSEDSTGGVADPALSRTPLSDNRTQASWNSTESGFLPPFRNFH